MARPGVVVTSRADAPPRSAPTAAGMAFVVGSTAKGTAVTRISSMSQYIEIFGDRTGGTATYDAVEAFFREGGTNITVSPGADVENGLEALTSDLGPGQVFATGAAGLDPDTYPLLLEHAAATNRIALLDAAVDSDAADLEAIAAVQAVDPAARFAALFAPPAIVPGVAAGTTRTVPFSAIEAGIMSRNDASYTPNVPAAGVNGVSRFAIDVGATFFDDERESLNAAGVNICRLVYGEVRAYGYRTLAPLASGWGLLSNARLNMEITAKAGEIGERYLFSQIDGRRVKISQFGADLSGMLVPYYEAGSLFGDSADDAFFVDVGPQVNTLETIAAGELHAVLGLRMSPFAEYVVIEIVKVATETPLALNRAA